MARLVTTSRGTARDDALSCGGAGVRERIRRNPAAMAGPALVALLAALAVAGPHLTPWRWTDVDLAAFREPPSAGHWLGTTPTGRDVYALTLHGMRRSLVLGSLVAVGATGIAAVAGTVAGYAGGWADRGLMGVADLLLVFPPVLLAAVASPALRHGGPPALALLLVVLMWPVTARMVRATTRSLRGQGYVLAARHLGAAPAAVIGRHILPGLVPLLVADVTLNVSAAVAGETGLSCLGFGVRPPDASLGTLIADGAPAATVFPWLFLPPVMLLVLVLAGVNLTGDTLRAALDPMPGRARP